MSTSDSNTKQEPTTAAPRSRVVGSGGAELSVTETGPSDAPTIVLVHGYPDTHRVWDELVALLAGRFHVVAYDVRGMGSSTAPRARDDGFALDQLAIDLAAVIDAVSPAQPVHLVGHDWGAFQCWEAVTNDHVRDRIASFTAVAGPRLDRSSEWIVRRLRLSGSALGELIAQARRSWYVAAFQIPALPERALRQGIERGWPAVMRRLERIEPRAGHPAATIASDARAGLALYRTNMRGLARRRTPGPAAAPVQVVVPTRDRYITPALYDDAERWATRVWRRDIHAGHWVQRSHPQQVARFVTELVDHIEGEREVGALRRARWASERRPLGGRLAVVTGAGSGIGRATALALAEQGAEVVAADIDLPAAKETLERAGDDARMFAAAVDVADAAAMEEFAAAVQREHGVPGIVVNNAGIGLGGAFIETTLSDWERVINVNLWGVIHGARLFARQMVEAGQQGQIVNVASAAAFTPSRMLPAYCTTKAAVLMLSECMRAELVGAGIGVTAICPGIVNTNIVRTAHIAGIDEAQERKLRERGARAYGLRSYPPERVAEAILRAIRRDDAVVPVTPEARVLRTVSQVSPAALRAMARLAPPMPR